MRIASVFSLHVELSSGSGVHLVGDDNFLGGSPEVLVSPGVSPFGEIVHWDGS